MQASGPLDSVLTGIDVSSRVGAARACAHNLTKSSHTTTATSSLSSFFNDQNESFQKAAAKVALAVRGLPLRPFMNVLKNLIDSHSFIYATPQLFISLERAPDRVVDLALATARRFVEVHGIEAGDLRTKAAAESHYVCDLVIRGLAQSNDAERRSALLDLVDQLMQIGAYGVDEAIENAGR
jgi:hypothetical protein